MQLANLECERKNIDMQIEWLRKLAKLQVQMNNQGYWSRTAGGV